MKTKIQILFVMLIFTASLLAGDTGKIKGKVTDADTGIALSNVEVFIPDTDHKAKTDKEGYFILTNVAPSDNITLKAVLVGYLEIKFTETEVKADLTTYFEIKMQKETE